MDFMVMVNKKKIEVSLLGQRFTVRSERDEAYVQSLAKLVSTQVEEIRRQTQSNSTQHLALLVALNLADELARLQEKVNFLTHELASRTQQALEHVEQALAMLPPEMKKQEPQQEQASVSSDQPA